MGEWKHRLSNINEAARTADCSHCGATKIKIANFGRGYRCNAPRLRDKTRSGLRREEVLAFTDIQILLNAIAYLQKQ